MVTTKGIPGKRMEEGKVAMMAECHRHQRNTTVSNIHSLTCKAFQLLSMFLVVADNDDDDNDDVVVNIILLYVVIIVTASIVITVADHDDD
ncbi:hypothetical protein LOAG_12949 [Loa loa]|uniref:Transmembrane protein n=1 Tax=Loa loa TaxID=7209 RepID=A0A1S0TKA6_LOALO|nr:hypothetical protein LOAG_12949 [Loa loa]EFO15560.1 hypothetical protein LOAG_12949 [Loa loa]